MSRTCDEQIAYNLGYDNPSSPYRDFDFGHLVAVNAFVCGQADAQNQAPRAKLYRREAYDPDTFERLLPNVEFQETGEKTE